MTLLGATTPGQSGPSGNEGVLRIPQAPSLPELHHHIRTLVGGGVLSLCRDAVSIFYSPSRQG